VLPILQLSVAGSDVSAVALAERWGQTKQKTSISIYIGNVMHPPAPPDPIDGAWPSPPSTPPAIKNPSPSQEKKKEKKKKKTQQNQKKGTEAKADAEAEENKTRRTKRKRSKQKQTGETWER
jgi:hypothetical protein